MRTSKSAWLLLQVADIRCARFPQVVARSLSELMGAVLLSFTTVNKVLLSGSDASVPACGIAANSPAPFNLQPVPETTSSASPALASAISAAQTFFGAGIV